MIIFFYGPDIYRSKIKLNEVIERYRKIHQGGLNLKYFDGKTMMYQDFKDELQTPSLFLRKKLVILKDVISNKEFEENFLKESKKFTNSQDIILFYQEGETPKGKLLNFLKKNAKFQEFNFLENKKLKEWIEREFANYNVQVTPEAIETLINSVGSDLWQLSNEIKKLVAFKKGKKVELVDVKLFINPKIEIDIFKTIDALALKNKKAALNLIHEHLERGDSPLYLLSMINFQFRNILEVKDMIEKNKPYQAILRQVKLHPYVIKKSYFQSQKFTLQELKKIYQKIFQADFNIKTGRLEPEVALDLLITEI